MNDSSKQVTVVEGNVTVERTIDDRSSAAVVVYRIETDASAATVVHVEESIPPDERIETLEFHPSYSPNDWSTAAGTVEFDALVSPDDTRMVVLGVDTADDEPVDPDGPLVSQPDLGTDDIPETNGEVPFTRGGSAEAQDDDSGSLEPDATVADGGDAATADSDEVLDLPDPNADESDQADDGAANQSEHDETGTDEQAADATGDALEVGEIPEDGEIDLDGTAAEIDDDDGPDAQADDEIEIDDVTYDDPRVEDQTDEESEIDDDQSTDDLGIDDEPTDDDLGIDDEPTDDDLGVDDDPQTEPPRTAVDDSLVEALLEELQSGNASESEREALRAELGVARADEVRFRHVQSRMDDFQAYVDALEGIINTHGTASEFVENIEREVTDIQDELGAIRGEVETVEDGIETADDDRERLDDEVAKIDRTVEGVAHDLRELRDLVGTIEDRTDSLETELAAAREERADQFDRIESELEATRERLEDDFEADVDSLREEVESFNQVRRTLLDAFGDGFEPTRDDDATGGEDA